MRGALKFETKNFHGVPPLFWDQKPQGKDKKKFGYKSRNMKFPLRANNAVAPTNDPPKVQPNKKTNVNKKDVSGTGQRSNKIADQRLLATKQKTKETSNAKQKKHPFAETVTLTKAQLDAILASVGKLPVADKDLFSINENNVLEEEEVTDIKPDPVVSNQDGNHIVKNEEIFTKEIYLQTATKHKEDTTQHREEAEKDFTANIKLHGQTNGQRNTFVNEARIPVHNPQEKTKPAKQYPATQPLSLAERKKRQWQKEKAELLQIYDPWGRPGAGAPKIDSKGQVITNYKAYNSQGNTLTGGQAAVAGNFPAETTNLSQSTYLPQPMSANFGDLADTTGQMSSAMEPSECSTVLPVLSTELSGMASGTQQPPSANQCNAADIDVNKSSRPVAVVPAAMRSSFIIGQNDIPDYDSVRENEKKKWLMELEKQKEEQRLRKLEQKDKFNTPTDSNSFINPASSLTPRNDGSINQKSSHLRGHLNLHMDPVTQQQLELKKRKNEELMLELQAQINEQKKLKQLEWEKKQLEEAEEEQRLMAEQQLLNHQYQQEMQQEKQKMEAKEQKLKHLAATIDQAREQALLEKKLKRLQYLERHGHDTSRLQADLATNYKSLTSRQSKETKYTASSSETNVCNQDQPLLNTNEVQQEHIQLPNQTKLRDFASQTDSYLLSKCDLSDVEIEYESEEETNYERIPEERIIPSDRPSGIKGKKPVKIQDRPTWGYQNPNGKKTVKKTTQVSRQVPEKRIQNQKTGTLVPTNKKEISSKINSGTGTSKNPSNANNPPKQSSMGQKSRLGGQQEKASRQFKGGHNPAGMKSDPRRGQEMKVKEKVQRDPPPPSPPVPTLRKKAAATMKPPAEPVMERGPRGVSPPVPAVRRKLQGGRQEFDKGELDIQTDTYNYDHMKSVSQPTRSVRKTNKYADNIPLASPVPQNDFIPFTRTSDVLDPANADSPLPISREQSSILRGRQSYWKGQQPANFGDSVEHFIDQSVSDHEKPSMKTTLGEASLSEKKALFQELSALKQKLRQLELETSSSMLEPQLSP